MYVCCRSHWGLCLYWTDAALSRAVVFVRGAVWRLPAVASLHHAQIMRVFANYTQAFLVFRFLFIFYLCLWNWCCAACLPMHLLGVHRGIPCSLRRDLTQDATYIYIYIYTHIYICIIYVCIYIYTCIICMYVCILHIYIYIYKPTTHCKPIFMQARGRYACAIIVNACRLEWWSFWNS